MMRSTSFSNDWGYHRPVMLEEVMKYLQVQEGMVYVDATMGGGGHSRAILDALGGTGQLYCFDRDMDAIEHTAPELKKRGAMVHHARFSEIANIYPQNIDGILFDFGVSSHQLDEGDRGFSINANVPLDMRMNQDDGQNAIEWLRECSQDELVHALSGNADMQKAKRLAAVLIELANAQTVITPADIRNIVEKLFPEKKRDHSSIMARIFQAIRMEINEELNEIKVALKSVVPLLNRGARVCMLTYHSVEDRTAKMAMREFEKECICPPELPVCTCGGTHRLVKKIVRKPLLPSAKEVQENSRARSAKLRVYERL